MGEYEAYSQCNLLQSLNIMLRNYTSFISSGLFSDLEIVLAFRFVRIQAANLIVTWLLWGA